MKQQSQALLVNTTLVTPAWSREQERTADLLGVDLLVRAGYAWWFRKYSRDVTLAHLEEEARQSRRGLWATEAPQAPWDYRLNGRR